MGFHASWGAAKITFSVQQLALKKHRQEVRVVSASDLCCSQLRAPLPATPNLDYIRYITSEDEPFGH